MPHEPAISESRRIELYEISEEKRARLMAQVAAWEAESKALSNPMVKIKVMLGEAAKQELEQIKIYHDRYRASLEIFIAEQLAAIHMSDNPSVDSTNKPFRPMTEAQWEKKRTALSQAAAHKARSLTADVLISYKRLILEYVSTNDRINSDAIRDGKSASARAVGEEYLASHAMILHSSLLPWRDGILFECQSPELQAQLIAEGWAAVGESGRLQFNTFAASQVVSQLKHTSQKEMKRTANAANQRLKDFLLEEKNQAQKDALIDMSDNEGSDDSEEDTRMDAFLIGNSQLSAH